MSRRDCKQSRTFRQFALRFWPFCQWCGARLSKETATTEHIIPLDKCGTNRIWNLALACKECNNRRGNQPADKPLLGPRWYWPHDKKRTTYFLLPLTRHAVVALYKRRRPLLDTNCVHSAFPIPLPLTVETPPMSPGWPVTKTRYEAGDMLVLADTTVNNDPLICLVPSDTFHEDYATVPYEGVNAAKRGGVVSVTVNVHVTYQDGSERMFVPLDVGPTVTPNEMQRLLIDAGSTMACEIALG